MKETARDRKELQDRIAAASIKELAKNILGLFGLNILWSFNDAADNETLKYTVEFLDEKNVEAALDRLKIGNKLTSINERLDLYLKDNEKFKVDLLEHLRNKKGFPHILTKLGHYLNNVLLPNDPHKYLFENNLFFFPVEEKKMINEIDQLFNKSNARKALITGSPESGKTIIGLQIGRNFLKENYEVYYFRFDNLRNPELLLQDLAFLNYDNVLVIADNTHTNIVEASHICQNITKFGNIKFLFLSRDTELENRFISEYDNTYFKDYFNETNFKLSTNSFEAKAEGIISKYKSYYEKKSSEKFDIGNIKFVINNSHNNLVTLFYNLEFWDSKTRLDKLDKNEIFKKLFKKYLVHESYQKLLLVSSVFKYEIYYEAKDNEMQDFTSLLKNGIIRQHPNTNYFFLFHSSFAKLLLNSFTIHSSFKRYKSLDNYIFCNIRDYLLSFSDYPLNLEHLFHNLVNNHGQKIAERLLKEKRIYEMFLKYFSQYGNSLNLLFILYRIEQSNYYLAKKIFQSIPVSVWVNKFRDFSLAGLSVGLLKLNKNASNKATQVINQFTIEELSESANNTKLNLLANSIREIDKLSGQSYIGRKIYQSLKNDKILLKIENASLAHIGKSLSELYYVDKKKTIEIFEKIDRKIIKNKIVDSDIKYISKALKEFDKINSEVAEELFLGLDNSVLISKLHKTSAEGIGRSLIEFSRINQKKANSVFEQLDNLEIIKLLKISTIEQIAHTLSELFLVNEIKAKNLYWSLDNQIYLKKIHNRNTSLHKLGNVLKNFRKIDSSKEKLKEIICSIDVKLFAKRAQNLDFSVFAVSLVDIGIVNRQIAENIYKNIDKNKIFEKGQKVKFQHIGRSLGKFKSFDKELADKIAYSIDWKLMIEKGRNISFAQIANCLADLNKYNKLMALGVYQSLEMEHLVNIALKSNTSVIRDSLRKLRKVDESRSKEIFQKLDII